MNSSVYIFRVSFALDVIEFAFEIEKTIQIGVFRKREQLTQKRNEFRAFVLNIFEIVFKKHFIQIQLVETNSFGVIQIWFLVF